MSKKSPFIFTVNNLCNHLPNEYKPSISREIRQLKKSGFLSYKIVGKKVGGVYKIILPDSSQRYTKKAVTLYLQQVVKNVKENSSISLNDELKGILGVDA